MKRTNDFSPAKKKRKNRRTNLSRIVTRGPRRWDQVRSPVEGGRRQGTEFFIRPDIVSRASESVECSGNASRVRRSPVRFGAASLSPEVAGRLAPLYLTTFTCPSTSHLLNLPHRTYCHADHASRCDGAMTSRSRLPTLFLLFVLVETEVNGHGRLMDPPSRNSMWRFGFPNPVNYNDNELFCGGYAVQWVQNEGQCGVCGDAYHLNKPRPHEAGGEFAKGTIVRHYSVGQDIDVEIELTANHQGRFEMHLCPNNNPKIEATQECFDRYPLYLKGTRDVSFVIPDDAEKKAIFRYQVTLPPYVTCTQCVIQWNYYTANMWGTCPNGTESVGCGRPETFRNCADVNIVTSTAGRPPLFVQQDNPFLLYYRDYRTPNNVFPLVIRSQVCVPTNLYRRIPGMGEWCQRNCLRYPPNCPETVCQCPEVCDAIGEIAEKEGASVYCLDKCLVYPSECPSNRCRCY